MRNQFKNALDTIKFKHLALIASIAVAILANPAVNMAATAYTSTNTASGCVVHVTINNYAYYPDIVSVHKGCTVTWTNKDISIHTVTSTTGAFGSMVLSPGQSYSHTFTSSGKHVYFCEIHGFMLGEVKVS
jgi:plastocyanin